ncbi:MAG: glycosyltransferase family 2 protein [Deltaproteobacteria bacterium]|nr:glycosyltransferase family 2 protein [Deltaproteobacteria bacterium]
MAVAVTVGVVTASWNGGAHTDRCIASVREQALAACRIFLVDNASGAAERARLHAAYGSDDAIELIDLPENRGYAGGNNVGIERALHAGADYVLVLTQDATLAPGALARLLQAARQYPAAGILGPRVVDRQTGREQSRGERIVLPLLCLPRTLLRHRGHRREPYPVSGLLGCALLLTRRCLDGVGAFDPEFFAYYEEVDLCLRARRAGFELRCVPQALVTHDGLRGFGSGFTPLSAELKSRNLLQLVRKHGRWRDWLGFWPLYAALIASSMAWYAAQGRREIVRALGRGVRQGWYGETGGPSSATPAV